VAFSEMEFTGELESQPVAWLGYAHALMQRNKESVGAEKALQGVLRSEPSPQVGRCAGPR
jgi:hypothetical protein